MRKTSTQAGLLLLVVGVAMSGCAKDAPPPTGVSATLVDPWDPDAWHLVRVSWMPPPGAREVVVERRQPPGPFQEVARLTGGVLGTFVAFDDSLPEQTDFEFRVVASYPDGTSAPSAAVPFHRGVKSPKVTCLSSSFQSCEERDGGFLLTVQHRSRVADRVLLERRVVSPVDGATDWTTVTLPVADSTWKDGDLSTYRDGAIHEYRVTAWAGSEPSPSIRQATRIPNPLPARNVSAQNVVGGIEVTFENTSAWANSFEIRRGVTGQTDTVRVAYGAAPPPGVPASFTDPDVPPGTFEYVLRAIRFEALDAVWWSAPATAVALSPPLPSTGMNARIVEIAPGRSADRLPSGDFALLADLVTTVPSGTYYEVESTLLAGSHVLALPADTRASEPGLMVDPGGVAHLIYQADIYSGGGGAPLPIRHAWCDVQGWRTEEVARRPDVLTRSVATAPDGALLAALAGPGWFIPVELATLLGGAWTIEEVPTGWNGPQQPTVALVSGGSGADPHLLLAYDDLSSIWPTHTYRDATGWRQELVPIGPEGTGILHQPLAFFAKGDRALLLIATFEWGATRTLYLLERGPSGWGAMELLGPGDGSSAKAARSADGESVVVAALASAQGIPSDLWVRSGGVTRHMTFLKNRGTPFEIGLGPAGKAWVLDWLKGGTPGVTSVPAVVYDEL